MEKYKLEPASSVYPGLIRKLTIAGMDPKNQWFFSDGAFSPDSFILSKVNTNLSEDFVVIDDSGIIAYITSKWSRPLNTINSLRVILFEEKKACLAGKAFFEYLKYLFVVRGCNAITWIVAEKNIHAYKIYEKFIKNYMGHRIGIKHYGQMSYSGEVSDVIVYEITREEYFFWMDKNEI